MNIKAAVYDARELSEKTKKFLTDSLWYDEGDDMYWLTKVEIMDSLDDDNCGDQLTDIPDSWWAESGFKMDQRKVLEDLWRRNPSMEARWETA